jgi:two-component system sensor histidine kinase PilS (NtrC family)
MVEELYRKIKWTMLIRLMLATLIMSFGGFLLLVDRIVFYAILCITYLLTIVYLLLLTRRRNLRGLTWVQVVLDTVLITVAVHYTGGIESAFVLLYVLPIIYSNIILSRRAGVITTVIVSTQYAALTVMEYRGILPVINSAIGAYGSAISLFYWLYVRITVFGITNFLAGYFSRSLEKQKKRFDELKRLNESILQNMGSGLIATDEHNRVIYFNRAAEDILGIRNSEAKGNKIKDIFGSELVETNVPVSNHEKVITTKEGRIIPIGFSVSFLRNGEGKSVGNIVIFKDLSEIKAMEEKVRRADRLSVLGEMAAGIAHEIRNPLASISGCVELLKKELNVEVPHRRLLDVVVKESDRLNNIVTGFLNYARPCPVRAELCDIDGILNDVILLLKSGGDLNEKITIRYHSDNGKIPVRVDPGQIKQVFLNILINAIEAMPDGGDLVVSTRRVRQGGSMEVVEAIFSDTGCGIEQEHLKRLFEPFHSTKPKGVGVGLAVANQIVRQHHGEIDVKSQVGKGSTFVVRLPVSHEGPDKI